MLGQNAARGRYLILALLCVSPLGCASQSLFNWKATRMVTADAKNPVARIVCIWEPAEGHGLDGAPTRGFAGQILFFTRSAATPAKVSGDVRVFLFDDVGTIEEQSKPIHQFDFLGEAWTTHLQQSTLGPAYNVFIPYVRKHAFLANCALRVRLTPPEGEGSAVYSETVYVTLPGKNRSNELDPNAAPLQVQNAPRQLGGALPTNADLPLLGATLEHHQMSVLPVNSATGIAVPQQQPVASAVGSSPDARPHLDDDLASHVQSRAAEELLLEGLQSLQAQRQDRMTVNSATPTDPAIITQPTETTSHRFRLSAAGHSTAGETL